ncbi:flagellar filament capping protein FliD [Saccharothrix violaceirubra]|uniref:Flagellar hook-associated protein 2 n=1 Tax=Saccharothrix violaceirubra TaxID=413306 RepID=A0A7W7T873_9PSEU|nr:flagellar filament capping protein FliD [Saccharothrix violaceirubra]MBB4968354.1 flagellar hook-associated protein 2 [Saccharothrix violaceirubra]
MTSSVDGLVSGLSTSTIINQLMQLEAAPQTRLKKQVSAEQTLQSNYQAVNARMLAVRNAAETLTSADTWNSVTVTSSSDAVSGVAGTGALTGTATFDVVRTATRHVASSAVPQSGSLTTNGSLTVTVGNKATSVAVTTDTAQGVADAINKADLGVRATVLTTTTGSVLQFSGTGTGAAKAFTIDGLTSGTTVITQGADALVTVGNPNAGGYQLTSADNNFTGLIPGVTVTVSKAATNVTVTADQNTAKLADAMQSLVNAINSAASDINNRSSYNATTKTSGALNGDPLVRGLRQSLLGQVSSGVEGLGSAAKLGVQLGRDGTVTFDRGKFLASLKEDPAAVKTAVQTKFAEGFRKTADAATNTTDGKLTQIIQGRDNVVRSLNKQIDDWDSRLADRKVALQRQYTALETTLGKLKDQSTWLAGQLSSLSSS